MVERCFHEAEVAGSTPARAINKMKNPIQFNDSIPNYLRKRLQKILEFMEIDFITDNLTLPNFRVLRKRGNGTRTYEAHMPQIARPNISDNTRCRIHNANIQSRKIYASLELIIIPPDLDYKTEKDYLFYLSNGQ